MRKSILNCLCMMVLYACPMLAQTKFGALAIDRSNGFYYGFAYDHTSQAEADSRALTECRNRGGQCEVVLWWSGAGCAAYRTVDGNVGTAYGWGIAATKEQADAIAISECQKRSNGKPASNFAWGCNSGNELLRTGDQSAPTPVTTAQTPQGTIVFNGSRLAASGDCPSDGVALVTADDETIMVMCNNVPSTGSVNITADFYTNGCASCPAIQVQDLQSSAIYVATGGSFSSSGGRVSFNLTVKELAALIEGGSGGINVSGNFDCSE